MSLKKTSFIQPNNPQHVNSSSPQVHAAQHALFQFIYVVNEEQNAVEKVIVTLQEKAFRSRSIYYRFNLP